MRPQWRKSETGLRARDYRSDSSFYLSSTLPCLSIIKIPSAVTMSELDIVDFVYPQARTERADFSDSDEEILNEIGEDDQQLYPDSD